MSAFITFLLERALEAAKTVVQRSRDIAEKLVIAASQGELDKYLEGGVLGWMLLYGLFPIKAPSQVISEESGRIDYYKEKYEETGEEEYYEEATRDRIWLYTYANVSRYVIMSPLLVFDRYLARQIPRIIVLKPETITLVETTLPVSRPLLRSYNIDYATVIDMLNVYTPALVLRTLSDTLIPQDALEALISSKVVESVSDVSSVSDILQALSKSRVVASKPHIITLDELIQVLIKTRQISSIQDIVSILDQYSSVTASLYQSILTEPVSPSDLLTPVQKGRVSKLDSETITLAETVTASPITPILVHLTEPVSVLEVSVSGRPWEEEPTKTLLTYRLAEVVKNIELMSYEVGLPLITSVISYTEYASATLINQQRKIVKSTDGTLYCVYVKKLGDYYQIYVAKSTDGGNTWVDETRISTYTGMENYGQFYPSIAVDSQDRIHVVWSGKTDGYPYTQIWYAYYDGAWHTPVRISTYTGMGNYGQYSPSIAVDLQDRVHIVWYGKSTDYPSYYQIWYAYYDGAWHTPVRISTYTGMENYDQSYPSIAVDLQDRVHVVWSGKATGYTDYDKVWYNYYDGTWHTPECLQPEGQNRYPNLRWSMFPESNRVTNRLDYVFTRGTASPYEIVFVSTSIL